LKNYCPPKEEGKPSSSRCSNVASGFAELLAKFSNKKVYCCRQKVKAFPLPTTRYILAKLAIHFNWITHWGSIQSGIKRLLASGWSGVHNTPSESYSSFTVYALALPIGSREWMTNGSNFRQSKRSKKLPVVQSESKSRRLTESPKTCSKPPHLIALLYGCGLPLFWGQAKSHGLLILDFWPRKMLHVKDGKGRKNRYVPVADILIRGTGKPILKRTPNGMVFHSKDQEIVSRCLWEDFDSDIPQRGGSGHSTKQEKGRPSVKPMSVHTLRHTLCYFILLEAGVWHPNDQRSTGSWMYRYHDDLFYIVAQTDSVFSCFSPLDKTLSLPERKASFEVGHVLDSTGQRWKKHPQTTAAAEGRVCIWNASDFLI